MAFKRGMSFAQNRFCLIGILISIFSAPLRAQSTSMQHEWFDRDGSRCSLRVTDTISQSPADAKEATMTHGALAYTPLAARCKFSLFLRSTYSPYTFGSAGFGATWAQATGQWPHYGGGIAGLGEAIWRESGGYRIAEIHPDLCFVNDLTSGSSLLPFAQ